MYASKLNEFFRKAHQTMRSFFATDQGQALEGKKRQEIQKDHIDWSDKRPLQCESRSKDIRNIR